MLIRIPQEQARQLRRALELVGREPFRRRSWAELGFFLASSALTLAALVVLGAFGLAGVGLTVVLVGVLVLAGGLRVGRGLGRWQRALARQALGEDLAEPEPFSPRPGFFGWLRASLGDRAAWRAVIYFVAKVPLTIFGIWFALSVWVEALLALASPLTGGPGGTRFGVLGRTLGPGHSGGPGWLVNHGRVFAVGAVLFFVAPWTMRAVVALDRGLMRLLLGPDAATSRVRTLEESRSKTLDAATETLRRIERNLHDGTQAQLVALAMRLGQAKEKLDQLDDSAPPGDLSALRRLVDDAHRGAKEAITDLRDLARGIHPPALDTGLENALATLAARSPVPTAVTVSLPSRPTRSIEAIGYFCAAELLANVAQHAHASRASLSCAQHGPWLRIVVRDDGRGGATVCRLGSSSSGLAGLADRVAAVDGHLSIGSPPGGPTVVTIDLPARG
ncbi:sensor domain-containing protein [Acidiferrimicrobium sp. IK]|uniref:sensor histidine kinase n=1 Tax=Acidiferrimicrobium sp. IK TaxID=2871700 RepID=UPI0021CB6A63|nr:sensor histidine kinase [Acidiferrimicrobium sp. IK]MCU4183367.1 sensor domain-containing protein [Acidiferrimicrobium sp. IK]